MQPHELDGLSWIAAPGALDALPPSLVSGLAVRAQPLDQPTVRAACFRHDPRLCFAAADGWTYAFGFQLGLGGLAVEVSKARGLALAFENEGKRGVRLCSVYRDGALVRQVSHIDGQFTEEGAALSGEPKLSGALDDTTVAGLARAWGADVTRVEWGAPGLLAMPPVARRLWPVWVAVAIAAAMVLAVRAVPSRAERCRRECERSWRATLRDTPECRGQKLEDCAFFRDAVKDCAAGCR